MIEVKVPPDPEYNDCADSTGGVGLTNINRVWAKAYLINANEEAMAKEGYSNGESNGSASTSYQKAQSTNDQLHSMLSSKTVGDQFFKQMASTKPAHLLGDGGSVSTTTQSQWGTSMVNRGDEANITYNNAQLPTGVQANGFEQGGKMWLRGYSAMTANGNPLC